VRIDGHRVGAAHGGKGRAAGGRQPRLLGIQRAEIAAIGAVHMTPDLHPLQGVAPVQVVEHLVHRIDQAKLGGSGHAHRQQHRPRLVPRLVDKGGEARHREATFGVKGDAPQRFFAEAEQVGGLQPGIVAMAGDQQHRAAVGPTGGARQAGGDVDGIVQHPASGAHGGVGDVIALDQGSGHGRGAMGGGEQIEGLIVLFSQRQGEGQPMVEPVAGAPHRLEIGHRAAGGEMPPRGLRIIAHHLGEGGDGLGLDGRADATGLLRADVGIVHQGGEVAHQGRQGEV
jgi:hypothetical protein